MESISVDQLLYVIIGLQAFQAGGLLGFIFVYGLKLR